MIDAGVRIIDRLIQLLQTKEKRKEKYFNNFVEPLYKDAETIIKDYNTLFMELISKIEKSEDSTEIIRWIEERRVTYLPLRMKVRALLSDKNGRNEPKEKFERGIWFIMTGGFFIFERGIESKRIRRTDMATEELYELYEVGHHTVLDMLHVFRDDFEYSQDRCISIAKAQLNFIQKAWGDVVMGYAELKKQSFS